VLGSDPDDPALDLVALRAFQKGVANFADPGLIDTRTQAEHALSELSVVIHDARLAQSPAQLVSGDAFGIEPIHDPSVPAVK